MSPIDTCPGLIFIGLILFVGVMTERYQYRPKNKRKK